MDKQMMKNLKQAISSVLETMFFLPVQITAENSPRHNGWLQQQKTWHVALRFSGPLNGSFFLLVPAGLAQEITANFLGLDETDVDPSQETDTVKEALNMIGGYVLSQAKDADEYQIGIPEIVNADQADLAKMRLESQNTIIIETEEDHLAIGLDLD
jgi:CheY-specific phosphatase CheX